MATYKRVAGDYTIQTLGANTITFAGNVANAVTVVIDGNMTVTGNATLTGNISGDRLFNGTTSIEIQQASGNANISVGGVSNVAVFTPTGLVVTGLSIPAGDFSAGNITATGYMSAAGNITTASNVNANGNIFITRDSSVSQPTIRFADTDTTALANTVIGAVEWYSSDATTPGARVATAIRSTYTDAAGNAKVEILTGTTTTPAVVVTILPSGNVGFANANPTTTVGVTGTGYFSSTLQAAGNITGGNIITAGLATVTGNIGGGNINTAGLITATGNITGGNIVTGGGVTAGASGVTATGNVRGGNIISDAQITATGNITGDNLRTQGVVSATGNVIANNISAGNIVSTVVVNATGNISATGNVTGANLVTGGLVTATGNVNAGAVYSGGQVYSVGNITAQGGAFFIGDGGFLSNVTAVSNVAAQQISNGTTVLAVAGSNGNIFATINAIGNVMVLYDAGANFTGAVSVTGNVGAANVNASANVSATGNVNAGNVNAGIGNFTTVIGAANASSLTSGTVHADRLSGSYVINVTGNVSGTAATVTNAAQSNITSVGTLTSLAVTGNVTSGNLQGTSIVGTLTTAAQNNITSVGTLTSLAVTGNVTSGNLQGTSIVGTLTTAAQNNITSVGTLSSLGVTGNIVSSANVQGGNISSSGNITSSGTISALGNVIGGNINTAGLVSATGNINGGNLNGTSIAGTLITAAQTNITSVGTLGSLAVTGNITSGNLSGTSIVGTLTTASQTNITSVGTLGSLSVTGNVTSGNLITAGTTGSLSVNNITHTGTNAVGNIGSASSYFNQVFATATTALYADLAEKYSADAEYQPGTVLSFGGANEVTQSSVDGDRRVAGVVSANPSYLMNAGLDSEHVAVVALQGRVPCMVTGPVRKGDMMVSAGNGRARSEQDPATGSVIGKALENFDGDSGTIEVVVGRI